VSTAHREVRGGAASTQRIQISASRPCLHATPDLSRSFGGVTVNDDSAARGKDTRTEEQRAAAKEWLEKKLNEHKQD
jgi:hypothetical protein